MYTHGSLLLSQLFLFVFACVLDASLSEDSNLLVVATAL